MESIRPVDELLQSHKLVLAAIGTDPSHEHSINNAFLFSWPGERFWHFYLRAIITEQATNNNKLVGAPGTAGCGALQRCKVHRPGLQHGRRISSASWSTAHACSACGCAACGACSARALHDLMLYAAHPDPSWMLCSLLTG